MRSPQRNINNIERVLFSFLLVFSILGPAFCFAADFSARTIGSYGNVVVMEVTGNYDELTSSSEINAEPRQIIANEFYKTYRDDYDFLVIFSNFNFRMSKDAVAFYLGAKNDVRGIGKETFGFSDLFGSDGKLQGTIDMGNVASLVSDPMQKNFDFVLNTLEHEALHRWGSYVKFKTPEGAISSALLSRDSSHWSFLLDTRGSVQYGNQWQDNGDGTFTSIAARKYYSPLDLYLMGMNDKSEVPPMVLIENPEIDASRKPAVGVTITGNVRYVTIDDIIAAEGERIPGTSESQKSFKAAFILVTSPGTFTGNELYGLETIRNEWIKRFSIHTDGRGIMQVSLIPRDDIPVNPGPGGQIFVPRTLPPNVSDGIKWLIDNQKTDGSWCDLTGTTARDTAEAVNALRSVPSAQWNCSNGVQWLMGSAAGNTDYLSRRIEVLKASGKDSSSLVDDLLSRKNEDGGWGSDKTYVSNPIDTAFALRALSAVEYADGDVVSKAIEYLKSQRNSDGGWGRDQTGSIEVTANVLSAFNKFKDRYQLQDYITGSLAWLSQKQNPDGGFGNSPSTIYDTAIAIIAFQENNGPRTIINNGVNYILNLQSKSGSWYESPHQTALAVAALLTATADADLSIKSEYITFVPSTITALPANIAINANIRNNGRTDVAQAKIVLYDGYASEAAKKGEQTVAVSAGASVDISFAAVLNDGNEHQYYVQIDPESLIKESDKTNNQAYNTIKPTPTHDFEVLSSDVTISPNEAILSDDVTISSKITNKGTMNTYNVPVRYSVDDPAGPVEVATKKLYIPAGTTVTDQVVWKANRSGSNLPVTIWADPLNTFVEISKTNNKASGLLTVWSARLEPDLSIRSDDITFTPIVKTLPANITVNAKIANLGRTDVPQAKVVLYDGGVSEGSKIAEQSISISGQSFTDISFPVVIKDGNEHRFYVQLDPENLINESDEANNHAYNTFRPEPTYELEVLASDLSISPSVVETKDDVTISAKIGNKGTMSAYNVQVKFTIQDTGGPIDIATKTINIPANSATSVQAVWKADRAGINMPITVWVDPFNSFVELSKENNKVSGPVTVNTSKDANLVVSYSDISITPAVLNERGDAKISSAVRNTGLTAASSITVNCYKGVPGADGVLLGTQTIPAVDPGRSVQVSFDWKNIQDCGEKLIYIKVDPDNAIKETSEEDNDAFTQVKINSLPDLAVSSNSIVFSPGAPKEGDPVSINVTIKNLGEQNVQSVSVKAYEGGALIGTQTIASITGNAQAAATFSYSAASKGSHEISVVVDPDNTIVERSKDNNRASRAFGVQDSNLWVTEPFISPNGDGIKDSTRFFFKLKMARSVKIIVVNEKNETVRIFSGGALDNTASDNVTWDGLNDDGMVVDDGQYQFKLADNTGNVLGSLTVVVDNNRSPLTKALGTKYLLNSNLTCMLPVQARYDWFPDDSGIVLGIQYASPNAPEFPMGIYSISPDGEDILRIVPWEWGTSEDHEYNINWDKYALSPDGEKIAFGVNEIDYVQGTKSVSVWVVDRDGRNLRRLDSNEVPDLRRWWIDCLAWFDKDHVVYTTWNDVSGSEEWNTQVLKTDGTERTSIDTNPVQYKQPNISPDGTKIAYLVNNIVRINDIKGNKQDLPAFIDNTWGADIQWMGMENLVVASRYDATSLFIVNAGGTSGHIKLSDNIDEFSVSPDGSKVAYIDKGDASVSVSDVSGNVDTFYVVEHEQDRWSRTILDLKWSSDSKKVAFIDRMYEKQEPDNAQSVQNPSNVQHDSVTVGTGDYYYANVIVYDTVKKQRTALGACGEYVTVPSFAAQSPSDANESPSMKNSPQLVETSLLGVVIGIDYYRQGSLQWLPDGISIFGTSDYRGSFVLNSVTGTRESLQLWIQRISPLGGYFDYFNSPDQSSVCYDRGYTDTWTMSSLLNLTAGLRFTRTNSAIILKGIATDLNFDGYMLEYADVKDPDVWDLVKPASNVPVFNDVFTTWVPPYEGRFYVRLTVWDMAGNTKSGKKRVSWGAGSSITSLYKTLDIFSPNGDGVMDTVEVHYKVLEPVHLEFNIFDDKDNLIRTFLKDHASPADDFITWDGRDQSGNVVPDGKYKIQIFDYEFVVEVDNTLPDISVSLGIVPVKEAALAAALNAHAFDLSIKSWSIDYKAGPDQDWTKCLNGSQTIAFLDDQKKVVFDANGKAMDVQMARWDNFLTRFLIDKTFRITAEDFAGNKRTYIIPNPLDLGNKVYIFGWDEVPITPDTKVLSPSQTKQGKHKIHAFDTIAADVKSYNVRYFYEKDWLDFTGNPDGSSHLCELEFDNSNLDPKKLKSVAVRAIDVEGKSYLSEELKINFLFGLIKEECPHQALFGKYDLFNKLTGLKIQVISKDDPAYPDWTDYIVYGPDLPETGFQVPIDDLKGKGMTYELRMVGEYTVPDQTGNAKIYSESVSIPFSCDQELKLEIHYPPAKCDSISGKAELAAELKGFEASLLISLDYFAKDSQGATQLLYHIDSPKGFEWKPTVDTTGMAEGKYEVEATLKYLDLVDNTQKEKSAAAALLVDRILPESKIGYPSAGAKLCPVAATDSSGHYGIPIEVIASDNSGETLDIRLFYGTGENPDYWLPVKTSSNGQYIDLHGSGIWDVTSVPQGEYSLKVEVTDGAGNTKCDATSFYIDRSVEITALSLDRNLISPNSDGILDEVNFGYEIDEYASVDMKVFSVVRQSSGNYAIADINSPIRIIAQGMSHLGGAEYAAWDGRDNAGTPVPDGAYAVAVAVKDSCNQANMRWAVVEVDNTPPTTVIAYPRSLDPLGTIVEVRGTSDDLHFLSYVLEVGPGPSPDQWTTVSARTAAVNNNVLGLWNTFGLEGVQTLRLRAKDRAGNEHSTAVSVNLDQRQSLIKDLRTLPGLFSPNNDGKLDTTTIKYELTDACGVQIDILDQTSKVINTRSTNTVSAGTFTMPWDGRNNAGVRAPDGVYYIRLTATLTSNPSIKQAETVSAVVDSTPPSIDLKQPPNNSFFKTDVPVFGTISDGNLLEYSVTYSGAAGQVTIDTGSQNRESYPFGTLIDLPEGPYTLTATARDAGENTVRKDMAFTVDRTPPKVTLDTPKNGEYYGSGKTPISILGSIVEKNLDNYSLRYSSANNPGAWNVLAGSNTLPTDSQLFSWNAGKDSGIPDGIYIISLFAKDKVDQTGETRATIIIDNTAPTVSITAPANGDYVREAREIRGTAFDTNLDKYTLEISDGRCTDAFRWATLKSSSTSVQNGAFLLWQALPLDGDYCLRLTASDKVENKSQTTVQIKIDTHPPSPPVLSGRVDNKTDASLSWVASPEPDTSGYNIYRGSQKINATLVTGTSYFDRNLKDGTYKYTVTAVDSAGNESKPSNEVSLRIDTTGPDAKIRSPLEGARVSELAEIKGTAYSFDDFKEYRLSVGQGSAPSIWSLVTRSYVPTPYGFLGPLDTFVLTDGTYSIKLEAEDLSGNVTTHQISFIVDNSPPAAPVLLSATPNGSDVTLTWRANTEQDLAGYLLYRNEQLANVNGAVTGNLQPYLITGTSYINRGLPDGNYKYYLVAMDRAGNISDQSNLLEVDIDAHPPHATITAPADNSKIQVKTTVRAESPDLDIVSVQFQFKRAQDTAWTDLGGPVPKAPFTAVFDPVALSITYGDYNIKATARDKGGNVDPSPSIIGIKYTDLTPPAAPAGLKAVANGTEVTLTWQPNNETDLDGYNVYRVYEDGGQAKVNSSIVREVFYVDRGLSDGDYTYVIKAVDTYGNESEPSNTAAAKIYASLIEQPYTPVGSSVIPVNGSNAGTNSTVEIFVDPQTGSGPVSQGAVSADLQGKFTMPALTLVLGENKITAVAKDGNGNTSRPSNPVYVVYNLAPDAPTGLTASVNSYDVNLAWNPNSESDLLGYNLYRNGEKINSPESLTLASASASSDDYWHRPDYAFDGKPDTYWMSSWNDGRFNPTWWQLNLFTHQLVNHIDIQWASNTDSSPEYLCAGKDFEIQAWSGHAWIPIARVSGNTSKENHFDFNPPYGTDRIRVYITDSTDTNYSRQVGISEFQIKVDQLLTATSYSDTELHDGRYNYKLTAVDYHGFESEPSANPSNEADAAVGDVTAPSTPINLTATSQGSNVLLNWTANQESDLAGYNVYRMAGQTWMKLNSSPVPAITYTDVGLRNGTYVYRVTAVDQAGNESGPSNEAQATVYVEPPPSPISLVVSASKEGGSLVEAWQYNGSPVSGFILYRSTVPGGPYTLVKSFAAGEMSHTDTGLKNGVTYYYVVSAKDAAGNESVYSNQASGTPADHAKPAKPVINYPALPGSPVTLYTVTSDICGMAEPGSSVELFRGSDSLGVTAALSQDVTKTESPNDGENLRSLSPSGRLLAYTDSNNHLLVRDLRTGKSTQVIKEGWSAVWASDLRRLFYSYYDEGWNQRIGVFDSLTGNAAPLTEDATASEWSPSMSSDGSKVAFISVRGWSDDVWLKNYSDGSLTQLTTCDGVSFASISPDAKYVAYRVNYTTLRLINTSNLNDMEIDTDLDWDGVAVWSPDSKKIAFVSLKTGNKELFVYDTESQASIQLTDAPDMDEAGPTWSPDSKSIAFISTDSFGSSSVLMLPAAGHSDAVALVRGSPNLGRLVWLKSGAVSYFSGDELKILSLKGRFVLQDARLQTGENLVFAVGTDSSGNASDPSDQVSISVAGGFIPDPAITSEDIFTYPPYPTAGDQVKIYVTVENREQAAAADVLLNVYLVANGKSELLKSTTFDSIPGGSSSYVEIDWDSTGKPGNYTIYAVADPENQILEMSEDNNVASRDMVVTGQGGIAMATRLDSDQYMAGWNVNITVNVDNSGEARNATLSVMVEDQNGNRAASLLPVNVSLPYGASRDVGFVWNTGTTLDGSYRVHSILKDKSTIIFENYVPFFIIPDTRIDASIVTDKGVYGPNEYVSINADIANSGKNHIVSELTANIRIIDPNGNTVLSESRQLSDVMPGSLNSINTTWQTALAAPGVYSASLDVVADNVPAPAKTATFTISSDIRISGSIVSVPPSVVHGSALKLHYSVRNDGNSDLNALPLKIIVIDPQTGAVMNSGDLTANLQIGAQQAGDYMVSTQGYPLKTYTAVLQSASGGDVQNIADTSFIVFDGTPPVVTIVQPSPGITIGSSTVLSVTTLDDVSGVDRVECGIDNQSWNYLPISDASAGRYSTVWTPTKADEGLRSISFRAVDKSGNTSRPVSVNVTVDMTPPTAPVIISPPDNSSLGTDTVDIIGTAEPGAKVAMSFAGSVREQTSGADGRFAFTGVKLQPGWNNFTFTAADKVGNVSQPTSYALNFLAMASQIAVNKPKYNPFENVVITSSLPNASSTSTLSNLTARVSVENAQGTTLFSEDRIVQQIDPLQTAQIVTNWNTAANSKGQYSAKLQVLQAGAVLSTASTGFAILGTSETGAGLSGTITADPKSVIQGSPESVGWSVRDDGNENVAGLTIKVAIINSATQAMVTEFTTQKTVMNGTGVSGSNTVQTGSVTPGLYNAVLTAWTSAMPGPKTLATTSFEVKPDLQFSQSIASPANLLVWVGQQCHSRRNLRCITDDDGCVRIDLLQAVLNNAGVSYKLVFSRNEFQREMRNPYYTDFLITGDHEHLADQYYDELVEQVNSGKGLITSSTLRDWNGTCGFEQSILGINLLDRMSGISFKVALQKSPITENGTLGIYTGGIWVDADSDTTIAGWMIRYYGTHNGSHSRRPQSHYPGIVLNQFGEGRTIFFAFDLFSSLTDQNFNILSPIIVNAINYVHKQAASGSFPPSMLVPVQVMASSPSSSFDVRLQESYPTALKLYDPVAGSWVADNPWTKDLHVAEGVPGAALSYLLTPDKAGVYTLQTDAGYMSGQVFNLVDSLHMDIVVEKDRKTAASDILTALKSLRVSGAIDSSRLKNAKQSVKSVINRTAISKTDMEKNVGDLLNAARNLSGITSCDVKAARLMIDSLIMSWEGQLYLGGTK